MVKKTSQKTTKKGAKKATAPKGLKAWVPRTGVREASTLNDAKNAIILVSVTLNAAVFIGWLILRFTTQYDQQVFNFLFVR